MEASSSTCAIHDPITVATYPLAHSSSRNHSSLSHITLSHSPSSSKTGEGHATVTVEADGVHIIDVTTSHIVSSLSLGPNTSFACPAVTRSSKGKGKSTRETYVAVEHSVELEQGFEGRTLWAWNTSFERATETPSPEKTTAVFPSRILEVHAPPWLPSLVLLVFSSGDTAAVPTESLSLTEGCTHTSSDRAAVFLRSFVFSEMACCKGSAVDVAAVVVSVTASGGSDSLFLTLSAFHGDGHLDLDASAVVELPGVTTDSWSDMSCDASGMFSILTKDLQWTPLQLSRSAEGALLVAQTAPSFQLASAKFLSRTQTPIDSLAGTGASTTTMSILHINTSQVLLAGLTRSADLQLLLWDLNYQALLASRSMQLPKPSSGKSSTASERGTVRLLRATPTHALVSLSYASKSPQAPTRGSTETLQSTILLVPFSAPPASSILGVLGRAAVGEEWLAPSRGAGRTLTSEAERGCLDALDVALEEGIRTADATLDAFARSHDQISDEFLETACRRLTEAPRDAGVLRLSSLQTCLDKRLLRQTYAAGEHGMLGFFLDCKDWRNVTMALSNLPDISEETLVKALKAVTVEHLSHHSANGTEPGEMIVETSKAKPIEGHIGDRPPPRGPPTLDRFVGQFSRIPTSPGALRAALKKHLDVEQVAAILMALEKLIEREFATSWAGNGQPGLGKKQRAKLAAGRIEALLPPAQLPAAIALVQQLLDTFLLLLLQHPPAHETLATLAAHLRRETDFHHTVVEELRGPLTMFAQAGVEVKKPKPNVGGGDSRSQALKRRREARAAREAQVTNYQVETVIF